MEDVLECCGTAGPVEKVIHDSSDDKVASQVHTSHGWRKTQVVHAPFPLQVFVLFKEPEMANTFAEVVSCHSIRKNAKSWHLNARLLKEEVFQKAWE